MDDKQILFDLAKAVQAIFTLQLSEIRATAAVAQTLKADYPELSANVQTARTDTSLVPDTVLQLKQKIDGIVLALSK